MSKKKQEWGPFEALIILFSFFLVLYGITKFSGC